MPAASKHHPRRRSDDGLDGLGDIGNRETDKNGDTHGDTTQGGPAALLGVMWVGWTSVQQHSVLRRTGIDLLGEAAAADLPEGAGLTVQRAGELSAGIRASHDAR
jgi:hypothetical protein